VITLLPGFPRCNLNTTTGTYRVNIHGTVGYPCPNLVYNLCTKHNINYINNDDIDNSLLNGSNLHLNKAGDKALGGAFCSFLKSSRPINTRQVPSRNNQRFFHQTGRHTTQWTEYLMFVSQVLRN
jgi:hypothetical protein